jgi:delta14-sterol reductase
MDITTDGYGFMLTFGNLVWVPFLFGVQARYLAFHPIDLGLPLSIFVFAWVAVGLWIFRSANYEKDAFRNGRNPKSEL